MRRPTANNLFEAADDLYSRMAEQGVELPRPANRPGGLRPFALSLWQHLSTVEQHGLPRPGDADPALLRFLTAAWTAVEGAELEKAQGPFGRTTTIASPAGVATHSDPEGYLTASEILALLKTADGAGSGLDADLLDGLEAAAFLLLAGGTMAGAIAMGGSKVTGAGAATANGDLVRYEQLVAAVPAGLISPTGWDGSDQTGWLYCDGRSVLRADYPALFTAISTRFGTADGTHFNLPDLEGRFLRGFDNAAGRDPDAAGRTAMATGGATGDNVGSVQADGFKSHTHTEGSPTGGGAVGAAGVTANAQITNTGATGGNETRPLNAGVAFYIKT